MLGAARSCSGHSSSARAPYRYTVVDPRAQEYQREFSHVLDVDPLVLTVHDYLPLWQAGQGGGDVRTLVS